MATAARRELLKTKLDQAQFVVQPDIQCDIFVVKGGNFRGSSHRPSVQNIFSAADLIIDAVTLSFRPKMSANPWSRRLPRDVLRYCYQSVPFGKMSFALRLEDDPRIDFMVFVVEDVNVKMPLFYQDLYKEALAECQTGQ